MISSALEVFVSAADDAVEHLALAQLGVAIPDIAFSDPLGLNLVALLEDILEKVEARARPSATIIIAMHEDPDLLDVVVEDGQMADTPDKDALGDVARESLLPVQHTMA